MDFKIAHDHPTLGASHAVFHIGDMPHAVKRVVNGLESSSCSSNLSRNYSMPVRAEAEKGAEEGGEQKGDVSLVPMNLKLCEDIWRSVETSGSGKEGAALLRVARKLTREHFHKTASSRMRVPLAVQVLSKTMMNLIDNIERFNIGNFGNVDLKPLRDLCERFDRFVDLMNGRVDRGAGPITSQEDEKLLELLEILGWLAQWKRKIEESAEELGLTPKEQKACFLTNETWEDMQRTVLGFVCCCQTTLRPGRKLYPRRCNQDIVEHHFAHVREACGATNAATATMASDATSTAAAVRLSSEHDKVNCGPMAWKQ